MQSSLMSRRTRSLSSARIASMNALMSASFALLGIFLLVYGPGSGTFATDGPNWPRQGVENQQRHHCKHFGTGQRPGRGGAQPFKVTFVLNRPAFWPLLMSPRRTPASEKTHA